MSISPACARRSSTSASLDQSLRSLRFGERDPDRAPEPASHRFGEERAQRRAPVSPRERRGVGSMIHGSRCPSPRGKPPPRRRTTLAMKAAAAVLIGLAIASCRLHEICAASTGGAPFVDAARAFFGSRSARNRRISIRCWPARPTKSSSTGSCSSRCSPPTRAATRYRCLPRPCRRKPTAASAATA